MRKEMGEREERVTLRFVQSCNILATSATTFLLILLAEMLRLCRAVQARSSGKLKLVSAMANLRKT